MTKNQKNKSTKVPGITKDGKIKGGGSGNKRHPDERALRDEASSNFYASEVCWGLTIAINMGMNAQQAFEYISEDFDAWASYQTWPAGSEKEVENG